MLALAIAGVSYRFVENPVRFHPDLLQRPILSIICAGIVTVSLFGAALLSMWFATQLIKAPEMKVVTAAIDDISRLPRERCVTRTQSVEVKTCDFGNVSSATVIVLFGDSHAVHWFNPLQKIAESNGWRLTTVLKSSCHSFDIRPQGHKTADLDSCDQWRTEAFEKISAMHPSVILLGNLTSSLGQKDRAKPWITHSLRELQDGVRGTLLALADMRVVIIRDVPYFQFDIPTCVARSLRHVWYPNGSCEADQSTALNPAVFESEQAGAQGLSNIHFIDLTNRICGRGVCRPVQGNSVIYRDRHHLTGSYADGLMATLNQELAAILNTPVVRPLL